MNNEINKLIDICARLPYVLKVDIGGETHTLNSICDDDGFYFNILDPDQPAFWEGYTLAEIKPYLFPKSSMTEEQKNEYYNLCIEATDKYGDIVMYDTSESIDWLNAHYFDYRGLIEEGLAIAVTEENNPYKS